MYNTLKINTENITIPKCCIQIMVSYYKDTLTTWGWLLNNVNENYFDTKGTETNAHIRQINDKIPVTISNCKKEDNTFI